MKKGQLTNSEKCYFIKEGKLWKFTDSEHLWMTDNDQCLIMKINIMVYSDIGQEVAKAKWQGVTNKINK